MKKFKEWYETEYYPNKTKFDKDDLRNKILLTERYIFVVNKVLPKG